MLPSWLVEFLQSNPYPSLSFMPVETSPGKPEVVFFYQAPKKELEMLLGNVMLEFEFYEETQAYIMRIAFYPIAVTKLETKQHNQTKVELEFPYVETEFFKKDSHIEALRMLNEQEEFKLFLYDKKTGFIQPKLIDFQIGKTMLSEFMKKYRI